MTILSNEQLFSDNQQVTGSDADSTNVIDVGDVGNPHEPEGPLATHDIGKGNPVAISVRLTEVAAAGAANFTVSIITGSSVTGGVIDSPVTLVSTDIQNADIVDGALANVLHLPKNVDRYLGLHYGLNGDSNIDVSVSAGITLGNQTNT